MRILGLTLLGVLCAPLIPSALRAQTSTEFPMIEAGEQVSGSLDPSGPSLAERGPFAVYRFDAAEGVRYAFEARSDAFDTYLMLARPVGGLTEFIRENDDAGDGTDSRIRFTADRTGPYLVVVQSFRAGTSGPYSLRVEAREPSATEPPRPIVPGTSVQGDISLASNVLVSEWDEEIPYDLWTFTGQGGEYYLITLESGAFDTYLEFGPMSGGALIPDFSNDDGGENTDSRLRVQLPHDGTFGIRARPLSEGGTGSYTLRLEPFVPPPPTRSPIALGQTVASELDVADAVLDDGVPFEEWIYQGAPGEWLRIRMASDDLDSYLSVGVMGSDDRFQEIASNDDGPGDGLNAVLDLTVPEGGELVIRARPLSESGSGSYTLRLDPFVPPTPTRSPIALGQTVASELDVADAVLSGGVPFEEWIYQGAPGERLTIRMASEEIDSYLSVGFMESDDRFREIASNDDGSGDGLNAVLDLTVPEGEELVIRARSYGSGAVGGYTLELRPGL